MDLKRLVIHDKESPRAGGRWGVILLCVACGAIGYMFSFIGGDNEEKQENASSRIKVPDTGSVINGKTFTAGGWIEVAAPAWPVVVTCRISERLEELNVREGQKLKGGEVIARLYDVDIKSRLDLARAEMKVATRKLEKYKAGYRKEEISAAEAKVLETAEKLRIAKSIYESSKSLKKGAISREALDKDFSAYKQAEALHLESVAERDKLRAGFRSEDIGVAQAELDNARSRVALAKRELDYCTIKAPDTGSELRVLKVLHRVGEWINAQKAPELVWLYDPKQMQVRVDVRQPDVASVFVGQKVEIVTEANPSKKYRGTVLRIDPLAELAKNTVTVKVKMEDPDDLLYPEMVAQVMFLKR